MAEDEDIRRARQARERIIAARQNTQGSTGGASTLADSLAALQAGIAESKATVKEKNVEIPTIALETAINSGNITAVQNAATELGKAQGLTGGELRTFAYNTAQTAAKGVKPEDPPADAQYIYRYVWRQDIGGPGGEWRLVKFPNFGSGSFGASSDGAGSGGAGSGGAGSKSGSGATTYTAPDGKIFTDLNSYNAYIAQLTAEDKRRKGQSAFDLLFSEFDRYGMGSLLNDVKNFIVDGLSRDELVLKLRATPAYEKRFAANAQRIKSGLRALSEAEYIGLEDQYQSVMRQYGLPQSYYARGDMGRQEGFEKFIAGDVSPVELEDRIQTAQNRVTNAPKQVRDALSQFYGTELGNGDILAYVLDPERALSQIKRKVTAAEIGAGAAMAGLGTTRTRAEELETFGVTGEQAREKFSTIAEFLPSAQKLGDIYAKQGLGPYNQAVAEQEVFGITGAADAATKRKKLAQLEAAQFSGQVGAAGSALGRERAGQF